MTVSEFANSLGQTTKSALKILLQSRSNDVERSDNLDDEALIILANGPSLLNTIDKYGSELAKRPTLAVNFAANAPEFTKLRPRYYVLADPHFFSSNPDKNLQLLRDNLSKVTWPMTLFVNCKSKSVVKNWGLPANVEVKGFNTVGAEGFQWFEKMTYGSRRAMPRPRNVLIPSIMIGIWLGYNTIYICGADHSWMRDIRVNDDNTVVSGMTHFYKEDKDEISRSVIEYKGYRLHDIFASYYTAFRSYHRIKDFADALGVKIINATPGSYIDAFDRGELPI